ncbi:PREDICTED: uncharacterized protein LOC105564744 [Vollenhovia emeryi]|uniref:uncharacterized protein LOC105564744 n=1 Tax=Vollenhovia emeryi TaxID=411798 RepID=UPI0005F43A5E|nr:PREDICTED: uncharacterized protein LOC105564744 [Vollenhovia emeryi]
MDAYTNTENLQVMDAYTNTENLQIMDTYTNTENLHVMDAYTESSTVITNNASQIKKQAVAEKWLSILENIKNVHLPNKWTCMTFPNSVVIGIWKPNGKPAKRLVVKSDLTIQIPKLEFRYSLTFIENKEINLPGMTVLNSVEDIMKYISVLQSVLLCQGRYNGQWFSKQCLGFVDPKDSGKLYFGKFRCAHCRVRIRKKIHQKKNIQKRIEIALCAKRRNQLTVKAERQQKKEANIQNKLFERSDSKTTNKIYRHARRGSQGTNFNTASRATIKKLSRHASKQQHALNMVCGIQSSGSTNIC